MREWIFAALGLFGGVVIGLAARAPWQAIVAAALFFVTAAVMVEIDRRQGRLAEEDRPPLPRPTIACPHCGAVIRPPFVYRHIVYTCQTCEGRWVIDANDQVRRWANE